MNVQAPMFAWFLVACAASPCAATVLGDADGDGDIDLADHAVLVSCLQGPDVGLDPGCTAVDLDVDQDVDLHDWNLVQQIFGLVVQTPQLFVVDSIDDRLLRIDLLTGGITELAADLNDPKDVAVDRVHGFVYWCDQGEETVMRMPTAGGVPEEVLNRTHGLRAPEGIFIDESNQKLYVADWVADAVFRSELDGTGVEILLRASDGLISPEDVVVDPVRGKVYWIDSLADDLKRCDLNGANIEVQATGLSSPQKLDIDIQNGRLYWTDNADDAMFTAGLDIPDGQTAGGRTDIVAVVNEAQGLSSPEGVAVDSTAGVVYWSDWLEDEIGRVGLLACVPSTLVDSAHLDSPEGIALLGAGGGDCNANGIADPLELAANDCNANALPDDCESLGGDCNSNGAPDLCESTLGPCHQSCCAFDASSEHGPGCIQSGSSCARVLILPGRSGEFLEDNLLDSFETAGISPQIWDWTEIESVSSLAPDERIRVNPAALEAGERLATVVRAWRECHPLAQLHILAGDGGALILQLAAEAIDGIGDPIIPADTFAQVLLSGSALSVDRSLARLDTCTSGGIYNYYSNQITELAGTYFCFFGFSQTPVPWPAGGRFGYRATSSQAAHITGQLGWTEAFEPDNNGYQFAEYDTEFFEAYLLPVFTGGLLPPGWQPGIEAAYEDGENPPTNMGEGQACFETMQFDPRGLAIDPSAGKVYWTDRLANKVQRANLNGQDVEDLVGDDLSSPAGIALDTAAGKMYWVDEGNQTIKRANLDGSTVEVLVGESAELCNPRGIALDPSAGKMYWTDPCESTVQRANLDGTAIENLLTGEDDLSNPQGIALDLGAGKLYFTDNGNDSISRANLDGTGLQVLVSEGLSAPQGIALHLPTSRMIWTDWLDDAIASATLDGQDLQVLVGEDGDLISPQDIAIDPTAARAYWTDDGANAIQRVDLAGGAPFDVLRSGDDAGCLQDTTAAAHVVILPGILGTFLSSEDEAAEVITSQLGYSVQIWDWTSIREADDLSLFERLVVNDATKFAGLKLAYLVADWKQHHPSTPLYIMGGSGGVMIITQACEARKPDGTFVLPADTFERAVFVSGAMSTSRSLVNTDRCVRDGIFNYYSSHDDTLVGVFCIFGFAVDFGVPWPAVGRHAYRPGNAHLDRVAYQLGWTPAIQLDNDGRHLNAYHTEFFEAYMLPVFQPAAMLPAEWQHEVLTAYEQ